MNDLVTRLPLAMRFYLIGLIYRNSRMSCVCLASLVEVSHDLLYRVLYLAFPYSRRLWEWFARAIVSEGYLIIDDTTWKRYGKKLEGVSIVWDSTIGKRILGTNVVLLIWTDGKTRIPLGLRIWREGGKSKVKLATELLWEARRRGIISAFVLFDAWYAAESVLNLLERFGWFYATRVKKNRLFNQVRIDQTFRHHYGRKSGKLKRINHEVLVVKDGTRFLLTNNLQLTSAQVKKLYRVRQQIEEVFRLLKQEFGWGRCRANSLQAQKTHLHLGLYAFCLVQSKASAEKLTIYAYKQNLFRERIPTQSQFLQCFSSFA